MTGAVRPPASPDRAGAAPPADPETAEREALRRRFASRLVVRPELTRKLVSHQGNRAEPGLRWLKYKEAFSADLVRSFLGAAEGPVLDPFAGVGTAPLAAAGAGREAIGIEILPVGALAARAIVLVANGMGAGRIAAGRDALLAALDRPGGAPAAFRFPHVPITERAFPPETEAALARARAFLAGLEDAKPRAVLDFACMSALEDTSYTRKDGQYLRWDNRSGRALRGRMDKGPIPGFAEAFARQTDRMIEDAPALARLYGGARPRFRQGSALRELALLPAGSVGLVVTSPPYANRYDYTRTYALELAWLGYDRAGFGALRQDLLSATVENRAKDLPPRETVERARRAFEAQDAAREALDALDRRRAELSNPHIVRLARNYMFEMAVVIAELARVVRPGGAVVMVNDNVQYHGQEIPLDLILSDIAERCGFDCEEIGALPRGKGNSSQQMGRFGRRELRKCVYRWRRRAERRTRAATAPVDTAGVGRHRSGTARPTQGATA